MLSLSEICKSHTVQKTVLQRLDMLNAEDRSAFAMLTGRGLVGTEMEWCLQPTNLIDESNNTAGINNTKLYYYCP